MGGKSSKNSWNTQQEPIQEISQSNPNSNLYESSIKWQPPDSVQKDAPLYINQHHRDIPNGTRIETNSLYYNQSQVSVNPTSHISENNYANPVQTTTEKMTTPTRQEEKIPKGKGKKKSKEKEKKEKEDSLESSAEIPGMSPLPVPDVHIPRAQFDRDWYFEQLREKKNLLESVNEGSPGGDEGRVNYSSEREEPTSNKERDRTDSYPPVYTNKEKATRPLLYQSSKQNDNAFPVKASRGNSLVGVDPYSAKNLSKESENSNPRPTALVQVLPSEPFERRNLKRYQGHRGSPLSNNSYYLDPDYNENRNSDWEVNNPSAEARWVPEIDY